MDISDALINQIQEMRARQIENGRKATKLVMSNPVFAVFEHALREWVRMSATPTQMMGLMVRKFMGMDIIVLDLDSIILEVG